MTKVRPAFALIISTLAIAATVMGIISGQYGTAAAWAVATTAWLTVYAILRTATIWHTLADRLEEQDKIGRETAALLADGAGKVTVREAATAAEVLGRAVELEQLRGTPENRALIYGIAAVLAHDRDHQETP